MQINLHCSKCGTMLGVYSPEIYKDGDAISLLVIPCSNCERKKMITKYGKVEISEEGIRVIDFHFDSHDGVNPEIEVLEWAKLMVSAKLQESLRRLDGMKIEKSPS